MIAFTDLGRMEYSRAWAIQKSLVEARISGAVPDTLLLVEHDDVVTLGRKTSPENMKELPIPVFAVERGGDATYHGPGQLVGYPIFMLPDHDVRRFVRLLEGVLIRSVAGFGIEAEAVEGHPGVWVEGRKLASIGVAMREWVTFHGFALNVTTDLSRFELISPCGLDPKTMTSMARVLGRAVSFGSVKAQVVEEFSAALGETLTASELPAALSPTNIK